MTQLLQFNDHDSISIRQIAAYYRVAKEVIIYGEQIDPNGNTLPQTLTERANILDHLMRVIIEKTGMRETPVADSIQYSSDNLDKAFGHTYRTAYDALDWVALTIREKIAEITDKFSLETIHAVMPDYFSKIKPDIEEILSKTITQLRNDKDIAENSENNLETYIEAVARLKESYDTINHRLGSLVEYESKRQQTVIDEDNKRKKRIWSERIWQLVTALGTLIIGFLLGKFTS